MTDLISRADAIEAVMKHKIPFTIQQEVAREIDALPSADAVHNDSCDGCKYIGVIEKCEQCRRIYAEFDDLYDKGGDSE